MNRMDNFKTVIAQERRRAGLTQEALATRLGITPQAISKWENGVGYPDVTLFPVIASVLDIPIARLFGEETENLSRKGKLPDAYGGMNFILAVGEWVCYASKTVERANEESGIVRFSDGSEANLNTTTVINRGAGEIRIYKLSEILPDVVWEDESDSIDFDQTYEGVLSYKLSIGLGCAVMVTSDGEAGKCRVCAEGNARFRAGIEAKREGDTLYIEIKSKNDYNGPGSVGDNVLHIHTGLDRGRRFECSLNGAGEVAIAPDFEYLGLTVNGCGDIAAGSAEETVLKVNGSGAIEMRESTASTHIKINGAGDIRMTGARDPQITVNGSGDIDCGVVSGEMQAKINGAGDVTCRGEANKLTLAIAGSGTFNGQKLSVDEAEITATQSAAEIVIGHIKGASIERLGKNCKLNVGRRG